MKEVSTGRPRPDDEAIDAPTATGIHRLPRFVKQTSTLLITVGLITYAAMSAISITGADIGLIMAITGAIPLWLARLPLRMDRGLVVGLLVYLAVKVLTSVLALDQAKGFAELSQLWPYLVIAVMPFTIDIGPSRQRMLRVLAISCGLVSVYAIWQHFFGYEYWRGVQLIENSGRYPTAGLFSNLQTWSGFSLVATLFFGSLAATTTRSTDRTWFAITALVALFANFASHSRGAIIGLIVGSMLMAMGTVRLRRAALLLLGVAIVGVTFSPGMHYRFNNLFARALNPDVTISRLYIWDTALSMGASRPIIGVGPGNFRDSYAKFGRVANTRIFGHAHNEWMQEWATSGLLGVVSFTMLIVLISRALWRRHRHGSSLAWPALVAWAGLASASIVQCHFRDEEVLMQIVFVVALGLLPNRDLKSH
jgi:O-antigen ligase